VCGRVVCVVVGGSARPNLEKQAECYTEVVVASRPSRSAGVHRRSHGNIGNIQRCCSFLKIRWYVDCGLRGEGQKQLGSAGKRLTTGGREGRSGAASNRLCVCVCGRAHTHAHAHTYTETHTHTHVHVHTHTHTHLRARAHTHTHIYINIHTHLYIHAYTYIHTNSHSHLRKASAVPPCPIAPERPTCRLHRSCAHTERGCARVSKIQEASANERGAERMGMIGGVAFRCNDRRQHTAKHISAWRMQLFSMAHAVCIMPHARTRQTTTCTPTTPTTPRAHTEQHVHTHNTHNTNNMQHVIQHILEREHAHARARTRERERQ
jgi:hypothetical protein